MRIPQQFLDEYKTVDPEAHLVFDEFDETPGAEVLEVGSQHSPVASILSKCGYRVVGVDLRDCDQAANYIHITTDFCTLVNKIPHRLGTFDAAVSISAIEHFGLNTYGEGPYYPYYDVLAMRYIYDFLKPGGVCYLTVPFGGKYVETMPHWRTYDWGSFMDRLVGNFVVERFYTKVCEEIIIVGRTYKAGEFIDIGQAMLNTYGLPNISCFAKLRKMPYK